MSSARIEFGATTLTNGKVLACGGWNGYVHLSSCELYDPTTGTWSLTGSMATARRGFQMTVLGNGGF
ncbi:MAG: hypothetical protein DMG15_25175 [Acidobacteria bacterium]|nr:MAG: hypothetical protein DMG15_25175 [Acidobacteriota bacterium]